MNHTNEARTQQIINEQMNFRMRAVRMKLRGGGGGTKEPKVKYIEPLCIVHFSLFYFILFGHSGQPKCISVYQMYLFELLWQWWTQPNIPSFFTDWDTDQMEK